MVNQSVSCMLSRSLDALPRPSVHGIRGVTNQRVKRRVNHVDLERIGNSAPQISAKVIRVRFCPIRLLWIVLRRADRCWLLFLFRRCGCRRCEVHRCRGKCRSGLGDGGVMPMTVLDGPHFSWRNRAGRLRCRRVLLRRRHGDGLPRRCFANRRSSRLFRRCLGPGENV
jgi:hypothetical protein